MVVVGATLETVVTVLVPLIPEEGLPDVIGVFYKPWRDDSYVIGFTILILERSFWLIIEHSHP